MALVFFRRLFSVCFVLSIILVAAPVRGADPSPVDAAVKKLTEEANTAFANDSLAGINIYRPHPPVDTLTADMAPQVLRAMSGRLTGDIIKDTYIRYHLMYVVNLAINSGNDKLITELNVLQSSLPADIKVVGKPESIADHPEIEGKYYQLISQCYANVGYPPFERRVGPPESFQYMDAGTKAKAQQAYEQAQKLQTQFKRIPIPANSAFNQRGNSIKWIIRQYRGELLYDMIACGDRNALIQMSDAIAGTAGKDLIRATDLASFLDAAYFNGMLGKYKKEDLKFILPRLKQAVAESTPRDPKDKSKAGDPLGGWVPVDVNYRTQRKLSEELFSVVTAIESERIPEPTTLETRVRNPADLNAPQLTPVVEAATQPAMKISPDEVTLEMVNAAIERGVKALERIRPPDEDLGVNSYTSQDVGTSYWNGSFSHAGNEGLSTWAMLGADEPQQSPWLLRRLNWMLCYDTPDTYDRALRLQMLGQLRSKWGDPWIKRDAQWLLDTMTDEGNWDASNTGAKPTGPGDNANGQYAVMGLWAAAQAGYPISESSWKKIDAYWRKAQHTSDPGAGGWSTISSAAIKPGSKDFSGQVTAPMTAGGCLSLFLTEMYLYGPKRVELGQSLSPELLAGLHWLDENMSLDKIDGDADFYFYVWTLQNVGQTTGYRTFNKIDWFREVTARLLSSQQPDGTWIGPKSINVSTSFALLYLARARGPLAICKVRFGSSGRGGSWDNRPNDLYNLATDLSDRFETPTSWQIADLDQPVYQLIESPMLYLATDKEFKLLPEQVQRLREYIDAGGLLVCVPEGDKPDAATASMKSLATQLSPGIEPVLKTELTDPFFSLGAKLKKAIPILTYENSIRPRVLIVQADLSRELQADSPANRAAFDLLSNIYLYVAGRNPQRPRIERNFVEQRRVNPTTRMSIARVKCLGDFDPEPAALPQLRAIVADQNNIDLQIAAIDPTALSAGTKIAFLSASPSAKLSDEQATALKKWVAAGGTLWLDAAGGGEAALNSQDKMMQQLGIDADALQLMADNPIITGQGLPGGFDNKSPEYRAFRKEKPTVRAQMIDGRPGVLVFRGDIVSGLAGLNHWGIAGLTPKSARQIVINSVLLLRPIPPAPTTRLATMPTTQPK